MIMPGDAVDLYIQEGFNLLDTKDFLGAVKRFRQLDKQFPSDTRVMVGLARAEFAFSDVVAESERMKHLDLAKELLRKVLNVDDLHEQALSLLKEIESRIGKTSVCVEMPLVSPIAVGSIGSKITNADFLDFCKDDRYEDVKSALAEGFNPDFTIGKWQTRTTLVGHEYVSQIRIKRYILESPLSAAIFRSNIEVAKLLIEHSTPQMVNTEVTYPHAGIGGTYRKGVIVHSDPSYAGEDWFDSGNFPNSTITHTPFTLALVLANYKSRCDVMKELARLLFNKGGDPTFRPYPSWKGYDIGEDANANRYETALHLAVRFNHYYELIRDMVVRRYLISRALNMTPEEIADLDTAIQYNSKGDPRDPQCYASDVLDTCGSLVYMLVYCRCFSYLLDGCSSPEDRPKTTLEYLEGREGWVNTRAALSDPVQDKEISGTTDVFLASAAFFQPDQSGLPLSATKVPQVR